VVSWNMSGIDSRYSKSTQTAKLMNSPIPTLCDISIQTPRMSPRLFVANEKTVGMHEL
jgi:hypothetical protein